MSRPRRYLTAVLAAAAVLAGAAWLVFPVHTESALEALFPWVHHLTKEPWIQNPSPTAMTVQYEVDAPGEGQVRFGDSRHLDRAAPARLHAAVSYPDATGYVYRARLTELTPGTTYRYRVVHQREGGGQVKSSVAAFTTWPETADRVAFIVYGDSRDGEEVHRRMARQFDRFHPAFILHTGDAVRAGLDLSQWEPQFFEPLDDILDHLPLFIVMGNHDGTADDLRLWFDLPGNRTWYSFDCGPVHVAVLDSYDLTPEVAAWLAADLGAARAPWKIVAFHDPVTPGSCYLGDFNRQTLLPLLEKHRVDVVVAGHVHAYQRFKPVRITAGSGHAVTFVTTGGGGAPLYPVSCTPDHAFASSQHHYCVCTIDGAKLTLQAFDASGREIDRVAISKVGGRLDPAYVGEARTWELAEQAVPQSPRADGE